MGIPSGLIVKTPPYFLYSVKITSEAQFINNIGYECLQAFTYLFFVFLI
jgi:hypothetical protein